jgi:hypothetical protein
MICYNHKDKQAVAICKNCFKAICEECAIPDDNGFACSEKCHQEIITYHAIMDNSKRLYGLKQGRTPILTILLLVGGVPFIILGVSTLLNGFWNGLFALVMGIIFISLGIVSYKYMKKTGLRA